MLTPNSHLDHSGDDSFFQEALLRMVQTTTGNAALRDDLMQEALVHLWLMTTRRPGQTRSWYVQSCKFHVRHYLSSGRSVDSGKRRAGQVALGSLTPNELPELVDSGDSVFSCVSARDLVSLLSRYLMPEEKAVLDGFAQGLGPREIGRKLKVSHTLIIKRRQKLASLLKAFEAMPHRWRSPSQHNGTPHRNGVSSPTTHLKGPNGSERVNGAVLISRSLGLKEFRHCLSPRT
jgi:DNA-directed RNA polymerase specialized sigma24 family protein